MDFSANPDVVSAVAEAHRLSYGHLFNSAFATETSLIDPLPHQHIAVYEHMLQQTPLRFLLADDAGAGKTIMTGPVCARNVVPSPYPSCAHSTTRWTDRQLGARDAFPVSPSLPNRKQF